MKKTLLTERFQELAGIKNLSTYISEQETETTADNKIAKDAEKLADSPILNQINTRDEWEDAMDVLMKKANDIDQVSDSVKRTWLQNALKAI